MIKKLSKYGNSYAVLIEKPILELLNISENTQLKITTDGHSIIIEPVVIKQPDDSDRISDDPKTQKLYEALEKKYEKAFKKLAKS